MAPTNSSSEGRQRGENAISLENFGQRKGQVRALEEFRVRKEKKRVETAKALRKYKKAMKKEGLDAGRGASRKRVEKEPNEADAKEGTERRKKSNPFQKSKDLAAKKKESIIQRQKDKEQNEKDRQKRLRERKNQTRLLSKRSKRGQPIMKHTVNNMLIKLQKMEK